MISAKTAGFDWPALDSLADNLREELDKVVRRTAFEIERDAKLFAPVDTGALRNSIYSVTSKSSGRSAAVAKSSKPRPSSKRPGVVVTAKLAGPHPPLSPLHLGALVAVAVEYGAPVNYGTANMGANGFLTRAMWKARPKFRARVAAVLGGGKA